LTDEELDGIVDEVDEDGSGTIDYDGTVRNETNVFRPQLFFSINEMFCLFCLFVFFGWLVLIDPQNSWP